eukprot:358364-Chlamydomonas_euryale.AAC.5
MPPLSSPSNARERDDRDAAKAAVRRRPACPLPPPACHGTRRVEGPHVPPTRSIERRSECVCRRGRRAPAAVSPLTQSKWRLPLWLPPCYFCARPIPLAPRTSEAAQPGRVRCTRAGCVAG